MRPNKPLCHCRDENNLHSLGITQWDDSLFQPKSICHISEFSGMHEQETEVGSLQIKLASEIKRNLSDT
jgi:hypothetical protein